MMDVFSASRISYLDCEGHNGVTVAITVHKALIKSQCKET